MPQMLHDDCANGMFSCAPAFDFLTSTEKENHDFRIH